MARLLDSSSEECALLLDDDDDASAAEETLLPLAHFETSCSVWFWFSQGLLTVRNDSGSHFFLVNWFLVHTGSHWFWSWFWFTLVLVHTGSHWFWFS